MPCTFPNYIAFKTPNRIAQEVANALNSMGHITRTQQRDPCLRETLVHTVQNLSTAHQHRQHQNLVPYIHAADLAEHMLESLSKEGHLDPSSSTDPLLAEYLTAALAQTCTNRSVLTWTTGTKAQKTPASATIWQEPALAAQDT